MRRPGDGEECLALRQQGLSWKEIGEKFNLRFFTARKRAERWAADHPSTTPQLIADPNSPRSISTEKQKTIIEQCEDQWQNHVDKLKRMDRMARFCFFSDVHLPYQDDAAIELAARVMQDFDPDVVTALNDDFDWPKFSSFVDKRSPFEAMWEMDMGNAVYGHAKLQRIKRDAAPNAVFPIIPGNHDERVFSYARVNSPNMSEYNVANFMRDIVDNGVLWLGPSLHNGIALRLNERLTALHGVYATQVLETTMKKTLEMYAYQTNVIFGHTHRSGSKTWRGLHHDAQAVAVGCLCDLDPHYTTRSPNWQQSICLTYYDPSGTFQDSTNVEFSRHNGHLVAYWGEKEYRVKI